jgi:hypothetical protein
MIKLPSSSFNRFLGFLDETQECPFTVAVVNACDRLCGLVIRVPGC